MALKYVIEYRDGYDGQLAESIYQQVGQAGFEVLRELLVNNESQIASALAGLQPGYQIQRIIVRDVVGN